MYTFPWFDSKVCLLSHFLQFRDIRGGKSCSWHRKDICRTFILCINGSCFHMHAEPTQAKMSFMLMQCIISCLRLLLLWSIFIRNFNSVQGPVLTYPPWVLVFLSFCPCIHVWIRKQYQSICFKYVSRIKCYMESLLFARITTSDLQ